MNLLSGATGFIGGHVVEYLFQQGEISRGIFRKGSHLKIMDTNGVQGMEAELSDHHSLHEAMEGVDTVYSMASPMPDADREFLAANTEGLQSLLEAAAESKVKSFVHLSTIEVCGFGARVVDESTPLRPSNEYQKAKAEGERLLQEFSKRNPEPRITVIRAAKAIGPRDETIALPMLRMIDEGRVAIPAGEPMSFSHPKDVAQAMYKAALAGGKSASLYLVKSFDAGGGDIATSVASALGKKVEVKRQGMFSGSMLSKYANEQLRSSMRIGEQESWKALGYSPEYSLKKTCEEIANWYRKEPWITEDA